MKRAFYSGRSAFGIVSGAKATKKPNTTKPQAFRTKLQRFTYPENWAELRLKVFERDGYQCRKCGANLRGVFHRHVHHIVALARGGTNKISNLISLCQKCHDKEHPE